MGYDVDNKDVDVDPTIKDNEDVVTTDDKGDEEVVLTDDKGDEEVVLTDSDDKDDDVSEEFTAVEDETPLDFEPPPPEDFEEDIEEEEIEEEEIEEEEGTPPNPITQVGLEATENDNFYFVTKPDEKYIGLFHIHQDQTYMIGEGVLGAEHDINPDEVIFRKFTFETLQHVREIVSDVFYKLWFTENTLTDDQILSMQTTIRDGKKQTGRIEDEPLVFYKKDRNTLENRKDLQGDNFELICQNIYDNNLDNIEGNFSLIFPEETPISAPDGIPPLPGQYWKSKQYIIRYNNNTTIIDVVIAEEAILYFDESLITGQDDSDLGGM